MSLALIPGAALAGLGVPDAAAVLRVLSSRLLAAGAVTGGFEQAVIAREGTHPTGLPLPVPVAIPHTDPQHVLTPGIAVATLRDPVAFGEMGGGGRTLAVRLVVMLALADADAHVTALQGLMARLQDGAAVREMLAAGDDAVLAARVRAWLDG